MEEPNLTVLPCGCVMEQVYESGVPTLKYAPCKLTCKYYLYMIEESQAQAHPIEYRMVP